MLRNYEELYKKMTYSENVKNIVKKMITDIYKKNLDKYKKVSEETGVPPEVIFSIHCLESSCRFDRHLHNGDPLSNRTVNVPKGRPKKGDPPFTWEESAIDALSYRAYPKKPVVWDINSTLEYIERYNGIAYVKIGIQSPYVFGNTNLHQKGKYIKDGVYDPEAKTNQIGAAVILKELSFFEKK